MVYAIRYTVDVLCVCIFCWYSFSFQEKSWVSGAVLIFPETAMSLKSLNNDRNYSGLKIHIGAK